MPDHVPFEGSRNAPLVIILEAPGHWEHVYGRPIVGPSYNDKLLPWWNDCVPRLERPMFRILNVLDYQPRQIHAVSEGEIRAGMDRVHAELAQHEGPDGRGPVVIVPTGNYALYAVTGHGRVSFHQRDGRHLRPGIEAWRGSILRYEDRRGRQVKVIPTIHPAASFRTPGYEWVCRMDWQRIATDAQFRELRLPERKHMIAPSAGEVVEYIRWTRSEAAKRERFGEMTGTPGEHRLACSLDVETPKRVEYEIRQRESEAKNGKCRVCGHTKRWHRFQPDGLPPGDFNILPVVEPCAGLRGKGGCSCHGFAPMLSQPKRVKVNEEAYLGCIGYAWDPKLTMTVPTTIAYWQDPATWALVKRALAEFHADPNIDFGGQNFSFDAWWCATEGLPLDHIGWDLMAMHRVQRPWSEWHDLAFQASLDTRQPYWKDEAKDPESVNRYASNSEALWTYNGIDNGTQIELLPIRLEALRAGGRLDYYFEMEASMASPLLELSLTGIPVDEQGRAAEFERVRSEAVALAKEINADAGEPLFGPKAVSNAKMRHFLYETLRLPVQYTKNAKKQKVVSTDIVTIKRLIDRFPGLEKLRSVGNRVLKHRRLSTIASFVKPEAATNGRMFGFFKMDTLLGRLSCSATPKGEGKNLQNQDRRLRRFFLPERETP